MGEPVFAITLEHIRTEEDPADCSIDMRDWRFVPRAGEHIELACEEHGQHTGTVRIVMWEDRGYPLVRYR